MKRVFKFKLPASILLFALVAAGVFAQDDNSPPVLGPSDLPGYHLIVSDSSRGIMQGESLHPKRKVGPLVHATELWSTMSNEERREAQREGTAGKLAVEGIEIDRYICANPKQVRECLEVGWHPDAPLLPPDRRPDRWVASSPSGRPIGEQSWYFVAGLPENPQPQDLERAKEWNQQSLTVLFISNKTVVKFRASARNKPFDAVRAEQLARLVAERVR